MAAVVTVRDEITTLAQQTTQSAPKRNAACDRAHLRCDLRRGTGEPTTVRGTDDMLVATAEISSAAVLVHLEDGALLILRSGMLTAQDVSEVAAVLEDATVAGNKRAAALCVFDRADVPAAAGQ